MAQVWNLFKRISSKLIFSRLFAVAVDCARNWKYFYKVSLLRRCVRDRSNEMLSKLLRYFEWTSSLVFFSLTWFHGEKKLLMMFCNAERRDLARETLKIWAGNWFMERKMKRYDLCHWECAEVSQWVSWKQGKRFLAQLENSCILKVCIRVYVNFGFGISALFSSVQK